MNALRAIGKAWVIAGLAAGLGGLVAQGCAKSTRAPFLPIDAGAPRTLDDSSASIADAPICSAGRVLKDGRCQPCGGVDQPCCTDDVCEGTEGAIICAHAFGVATCRRCGTEGAPCCFMKICQPHLYCRVLRVGNTGACMPCGAFDQRCCPDGYGPECWDGSVCRDSDDGNTHGCFHPPKALAPER